MANDTLYRGLFELVGYMLTSARGLIDEPPLYGPFRLVDGVSRLCDFMDEEAGYGDFFTNLKNKIDERKFLVMSDTDAFVELLDEVVLDYTRKFKDGNTS
jgi:hypothetical protein